MIDRTPPMQSSTSIFVAKTAALFLFLAALSFSEAIGAPDKITPQNHQPDRSSETRGPGQAEAVGTRYTKGPQDPNDPAPEKKESAPKASVVETDGATPLQKRIHSAEETYWNAEAKFEVSHLVNEANTLLAVLDKAIDNAKRLDDAVSRAESSLAGNQQTDAKSIPEALSILNDAAINAKNGVEEAKEKLTDVSRGKLSATTALGRIQPFLDRAMKEAKKMVAEAQRGKRPQESSNAESASSGASPDLIAATKWASQLDEASASYRQFKENVNLGGRQDTIDSVSRHADSALLRVAQERGHLNQPSPAPAASAVPVNTPERMPSQISTLPPAAVSQTAPAHTPVSQQAASPPVSPPPRPSPQPVNSGAKHSGGVKTVLPWVAASLVLTLLGTGGWFLLTMTRRTNALERARNKYAFLCRELRPLRLYSDLYGSDLRARFDNGDWPALDLSAPTLKNKKLIDLVVPENRKDFQKLLDEARTPESRRTGRPLRVSCDLQRSNGHPLRVEGVLSLRPGSGGEDQYEVILHDVSYRVDNRETRLQLETLVASLHQGVLIEGRLGKAVSSNPTFYRLLGLDPGSASIRNVSLERLCAQASNLPREVIEIFTNQTGGAAEVEYPAGVKLRGECAVIRAEGQTTGRIAILSQETVTPLGSAPPAEPVPPELSKPASWEPKEAQDPWCPPQFRSLLPWIQSYTYRDNFSLVEEGLAGWQIGAATRRGRLHAQHGTHREDALGWQVDETHGFAAMCVSDGAGSSKLSRIGSEAICQAVLARLRDSLAGLVPSLSGRDPDESIKQIAGVMGNAVLEAARKVKELAASAKIEPKELRCTLLLLVHVRTTDRNYMLGSQVGDGCIIGLLNNGQTKRFGEPDSGQFSGEVSCFLPDDDGVAKAHRIFVVPADDIVSIILCSDGVDDPFHPIEKRAVDVFRQLEGGVQTPLDGFEMQEPHQAVVRPVVDYAGGIDAAALATWLGFEKRGENDDRTILLLTRLEYPETRDRRRVMAAQHNISAVSGAPEGTA